MKVSVIIITIVGLLGSSFGKLLICTNYLLNKEQITLNYCENKSKPSLKCNGKCHLKKQIKEQEKKEDQSKSNSKEYNEAQLFTGGFSLIIKQPYVSESGLTIFYLDKEIRELSLSVFHPPTS